MLWQIGCSVYADVWRWGKQIADRQGWYANVAAGQANHVTASDRYEWGYAGGDYKRIRRFGVPRSE
jgi:hypothetical protein